MQFFLSFYEGQLKQQICYSFILQYLIWFLIHLEWRSSSFALYQIFPSLIVHAFFPKFNSTGPWPQLQKGRKIPAGARYPASGKTM